MDLREEYLRLINEAEKELGENHPFLAYPLTGLADAHFNSHPDDIEKFYKYAIEIWEKHDPHNIHFTSPLSNLGSLYIRQGRYDEAQPLFERVLQIKQEAGQSEIDLIHPLDNLAYIAMEQGRNEDGEALYRQVSELEETFGTPYQRGKFHSVTLLSFHEQSLEGAQQLYQQTLKEEMQNIKRADVAGELHAISANHGLGRGIAEDAYQPGQEPEIQPPDRELVLLC